VTVFETVFTIVMYFASLILTGFIVYGLILAGFTVYGVVARRRRCKRGRAIGAVSIGVSVNGLPLFIWYDGLAETERIRETIPRIAKEAGTTPIELFNVSLNSVLAPKGETGFLTTPKLDDRPRMQQMQKSAILWAVLENETHLPEYPGKVIDHVAHMTFTVDIATPVSARRSPGQTCGSSRPRRPSSRAA
jgi:hypothetical protein